MQQAMELWERLPPLIEAVAKLFWPLSILLIALLYREQIKALLSRIAA
jgi:hypothetical protein